MRCVVVTWTLFSVTVLLIVENTDADCSSPYLERSQDGTTICYLPAYNCGPNAEIWKSTEDSGRDVCVKCSEGYINPFIISSVDDVLHRCFKKKNYHEQCPVDTIPTETLGDSRTCLLHCTCAHYECYYGTVPCECDGPREPCKENETMDPVTGDCIPCPENAYKLTAGCQPCTWNVTALLGDLARNEEPVTMVTRKTTEKPTFNPVTIATGPAYKYNGSDVTREPAKDDEEGFSPIPVIAIIVVVVVLAILLAVVLITYRKVQSNDHDSRFVKCYHALCPGKHLEQKASYRDTESVDDLESGTVVPSQNSEKPLQQVQPFSRIDETPENNTEDLDECSATRSARFDREQVSDINEDVEPTSVSPLIENRESIDTDLTEQKTTTSLKE